MEDLEQTIKDKEHLPLCLCISYFNINDAFPADLNKVCSDDYSPETRQVIKIKNSFCKEWLDPV